MALATGEAVQGGEVRDADFRSVSAAPLPLATVANGALSAAAAAIDTVVADTGALPAGTYRIDVNAGILGVQTAGVGFVVEHRNAANAATLEVLGGGVQGQVAVDRLVVATNERVRVKVDAVALPLLTKLSANVRAYRIN